MHEFPAKDEIADYLENYAIHFNLPLQLETEVQKAEEEKDVFSISTVSSLTLFLPFLQKLMDPQDLRY